MYFLGDLIKEAKFRRIFFDLISWKKADQLKELKADRKRNIYVFKKISLLFSSLIECGIACNKINNCNTLRFESGVCKLGIQMI